jgi:hypothetical protein
MESNSFHLSSTPGSDRRDGDSTLELNGRIQLRSTAVTDRFAAFDKIAVTFTNPAPLECCRSSLDQGDSDHAAAWRNVEMGWRSTNHPVIGVGDRPTIYHDFRILGERSLG